MTFHEHLALRFVPQVDFEASAPLDIEPKPDVVTRVFMLFEGIPSGRLVEWEEARERSSADVEMWKGIVGVDDARQPDCSIPSGALVVIGFNFRGIKPVIYLYPPTPISTKVRLLLVRPWKLSAVYPQPTEGSFKEGESGRAVEWDVVVNQSGVIKNKGASIEVPYLFWDPSLADSSSAFRSSSPLPINHTKAPCALASFIPGTTRCSPSDSVVLSVLDVPADLEKTLLALGLHTEARESCITNGLVPILSHKHEHFAFRFIPQPDIEASAPLEIDPKPDVITRVSMLFERIPADRLADWEEARQRSAANVNMWRGIVGVEDTRQRDQNFVRVLEWGGMEVR
ncbi:hypothetical protein M407DRAFT_18960 [Tulasnella calospora MUT 4182]|uniref:Uncharacterized protein n=1 Tax=Tulasnella calospora MUT 4182 TaxID=1051891 RepID=A0A0C3QIZ6_9AGAM|nr:hypothetical protein M407DRAFT_18960 [Tulasnella calospora MUT 4182]